MVKEKILPIISRPWALAMRRGLLKLGHLIKVEIMKINMKKINDLCARWKIRELSIFGSFIRGDFNEKNSDVDILISFLPEAQIGWNIVDLKEELEEIFKRSVDLTFKDSIEKSQNPYRKNEVLSHYEVIYDQAA